MKRILPLYILLLALLTSCVRIEVDSPGGVDFDACRDGSLAFTSWEFDFYSRNGNVDFYNSLFIIDFVSSDEFRLELEVNTCGGDYDLDRDCDADFDVEACTEICCDGPESDIVIDDLENVRGFGFGFDGNLILVVDDNEFISLLPL